MPSRLDEVELTACWGWSSMVCPTRAGACCSRVRSSAIPLTFTPSAGVSIFRALSWKEAPGFLCDAISHPLISPWSGVTLIVSISRAVSSSGLSTPCPASMIPTVFSRVSCPTPVHKGRFVCWRPRARCGRSSRRSASLPRSAGRRCLFRPLPPRLHFFFAHGGPAS